MPLSSWDPTTHHQQPMRTSSIRTLPPPDVSPSQQQAIVTLAQVRCGPRAINEYVDSPRTLPILPLKSTHIGLSSSLPPSPAPVHAVSLPCRTNTRPTNGGGVVGGSTVSSGNGGGGGSAVISTQPSKSPPLKDDAVGGGGGGGGGGGAGGERGAGPGDGHSSIMCSKCGQCRCAACSEPRELPAKWCCGNRYEVSPALAVEVCTCFCCIQAVFYHCGAEEENACYDNPCACGGSKCCSRWTCVAAAAMLLPCLWCYWPMRGCLAATTACYNCCRKKGCQCSKRPCESKTNSQTRRLLVESDSSSA